MQSTNLVSEIAVALSALLIAVLFLSRSKRSLPLPPGPQGKWIIGNLLQWPISKEWETFGKWAEEYGDLVYASVLGQHMIVVNSYRTAVEMLDGKSAIYSDRPRVPMVGELGGWNKTAPFVSISDLHRRQRKLLYNYIGNKAYMSRFHHAQEQDARRLIRGILSNPDDLYDRIRHCTGATILKISYGYEAQEDDDPWVNQAEYVMDQMAQLAVPGSFLVDFIPALQYIPDWFPGAGFKAIAKNMRANLEKAADDPFEFVKEAVRNGQAVPSFTQALLEEGSDVDEVDIKWSAALLFLGGADTTRATIYTLFFALALHPHVLRAAQAEIDSVVGNNRLPSFADREHLPYIDALSKELFRWTSVAPSGGLHVLNADDVHKGYRIPAGTIVFANIEKMLHDPEIYHEPTVFNPGRFIEGISGRPAELDPRAIAFGFGRRRCPGINLADANVFISCAMVVATLDVTKATENGKIVEPTYEKLAGIVSNLARYKVSITARSAEAQQLVDVDVEKGPD